jgi:hypothetical protein
VPPNPKVPKGVAVMRKAKSAGGTRGA